MQSLNFGPVRVFPGGKSGKYPDGNQVIVQGADMRVAFDTPQVSRHVGPDLDEADLIILGHMHEDHTVALGRLRHVPVQVHHADLAAAHSWQGLSQHYGYPPAVLGALRPMIERDFDYQPRPDATGYTHGSTWDLGGGVRVRAHHLPGPLVRHTQHQMATALIGQRHAVAQQLGGVVLLLGLLEFQVLVFGRIR